MNCAHALRVQAYFDGEVDAATALDVERHTATCAACAKLLVDLDAMRSALRSRPAVTASPALRARVLRGVDAEARRESPRATRLARLLDAPRAFWYGAVGGAASGLAAAAIVGLALLVPMRASLLQDAIVSQHVGSLVPGHLYAVASSDRHTVKPWFAGRADVSPVVADFATQGYPLAGGRVDYVAGQRAAVLVYGHGRHTINVFVWRAGAGPAPRDAVRDGYRLLFWRAGDLQYCAISDAGHDELDVLRGLLRESGPTG